jgi:hypothetical protein
MAKDLLAYFAVLALCWVVFMPLHIVAVRLRHGANLLTTVNSAIVASAIVVGAGSWLWLGAMFSSDSVKAVACVGAGMSFLGFGGLYNLLGPASVDRSISAHIIKLIYLSPRHRIEETELFKLYTHSDVLEKRFNECAEVGFIERRGQELGLTAKGRRVAVFYIELARILGMRLWYLDRYRTKAASDA